MSVDNKLLTKIQEVGKEIARLGRRVTALERAPQMRHTSWTGTQNVFDDAGNTRQIVGQQQDGTYTLTEANGPPPPAPIAPVLTPVPGAIVIGWNGLFKDSADRPLDLAFVEIHVSDTAGFEKTPATQVSTLSSASGGLYIVPAEATRYVAFVAVNRSLVEGESSDEASASPLPIEVTSDGSGPTGAPTVHATAGIGIIIARVDPVSNGTAVEYEWHLLTDNTTVPTAGSAVTRISIGPETSIVIRTLPDGSTPLAYGVTYYIRAFAKDVDAYGPVSSAVAASPVQINSPDIAADYLYANNIVADQITGGNLNAVVALVGTLKVGANITLGQSTDGTYAGIRITLDNGGIISFPSDGTDAVITANLWARSLTALGVLSMRNSINEVAPGAGLYFRKGTTAPATSPSVSSAWNSINFFNSDPESAQFNSIGSRGQGGWDSQDSSVMIPYRIVAAGSQNKLQIIKAYHSDSHWTATTVTGQAGTISINDGSITQVASPVTDGVMKYILLARTYPTATPASLTWKFYRLDRNMAILSEFSYVASNFANGTFGTKAPAIGFDGTNVVIFQYDGIDSPGNLLMYKYNPTTGVIVGSSTDTGVNQTASTYVTTGSVTCSNGDYGAMRYVVYVGEDKQTSPYTHVDFVYVFNSSGVRQSNDEWPAVQGASYLTMIYWDGTNYFHLNPTADLTWKYSRNIWSSSTYNTQRISAAWETATGELTTQGPRSTFTATKRAYLEVDTPPKPDGIDKVALYAGFGADTSTRVDMWKQISSTTDENRLDQLVFTGTNPVAVSTMPDSSPGFAECDALDVDGNPIWSVKGSGLGRAGPWSWNDSGFGTQENFMVAATGNAAPTSTANVTIPGLSIDVVSPGTGAVYMAMLSPDVLLGSAGGNIVELLIDGTPHASVIVFAGASLGRSAGSKRYRITGLSAGTHTFTARTRSQGAYTTTVNQTHSTMTVERIA